MTTPIGAIGAMCGFRSEGYLKRLFLARHGCTMREWRHRARATTATTAAPCGNGTVAWAGEDRDNGCTMREWHRRAGDDRARMGNERTTSQLRQRVPNARGGDFPPANAPAHRSTSLPPPPSHTIG